MGLGIAFWVLSAVAVAAALMVVSLRDVFRAALFLILSFLAVAGLYITLSADFLAAVQVLIYVGAIAVLIVFVILLTREVQQANPSGRLRVPTMIVGLLLLTFLILSLVNTPWHIVEAPAEPTTTGIAHRLFSLEEGFVLPFEIASVLLLVAMIGAIILVREK